MNTLGQKIRELRIEKGLEQKELATILQVHKGTISNWENDKRSPDNEMLSKISTYFDVPVDYLLGKIDKATYKKAMEILDTFLNNGISIDDISLSKLEKVIKMYSIMTGTSTEKD